MTPEMNPIDTVRELATHASDIRHLQEDMDKLVHDVHEIKQSLQAIQQALSEATGGRKMLFLSLSTASMIGGAVTWLVDRWIFK